MDKIITNNIGLIQGYQEVYGRIQDCYSKAIINLTKVFGNNIIIDGCVVADTTISNGIIVMGGEVLPFEGGALKAGIAVAEVTANEDYHYYGAKPFYITKKAVLHDAGLSLSSFVRVKKILQHWFDFNNPHAVTKLQVGLDNLPNAISDAIDLNDTNSLASSKAVNDMYPFSKFILGSLYIGNLGLYSDNNFTITHNAGTTNYTVIITPSTKRPITYSLEDVLIFWRVMQKNANTCVVKMIERIGLGSQEITLNYLIMKNV